MPLEERLGPGGLDPGEVFNTLPEAVQVSPVVVVVVVVGVVVVVVVVIAYYPSGCHHVISC